MNKNYNIIALDLEGTLITSFNGLTPRPGLKEFLDFCYANFDRVVVYTLLSKAHAKQIAQLLVKTEHAPTVFISRFEYISGPGPYKDLSHVENADHEKILLVDDTPSNINPAQKDNWIRIKSFAGHKKISSFGEVVEQQDQELQKTREIIEKKLAG